MRAKSHHLGRIPLHFQYRFDRPGTYEVRYTFRKGLDPSEPPDVQSGWTPIQILPGSPSERARWLAETAAHAPTDAVDLLTDFLPAILGIPDEPSLQLLCQYLYHPDTLVRQFAMYGLALSRAPSLSCSQTPRLSCWARSRPLTGSPRPRIHAPARPCGHTWKMP